MPRHSRYLAAAVAIATTVALAVLSSALGAPAPPDGASSPFLAPTTMSHACGSGARYAACGVVARFFQSVNSREYTAACGLLGARLRSESYGMTCERFIRAGSPEPMPWGIVDARATGHGVVVQVTLGQTELDHIRMRHHRAFVGVERGQLRILSTRLVS
jgi:hypothetical protein